MQVKPLPPDDVSCPPPPDADPRPTVRVLRARQDDLARVQQLLALGREVTAVAHALAVPDPSVVYTAAYRLGLQARLMDARIVLTGIIGSLTPQE
jgi:hypothetical protein